MSEKITFRSGEHACSAGGPSKRALMFLGSRVTKRPKNESAKARSASKKPENKK